MIKKNLADIPFSQYKILSEAGTSSLFWKKNNSSNDGGHLGESHYLQFKHINQSSSAVDYCLLSPSDAIVLTWINTTS